MKAKIDTSEKTITLEESINIGELLRVMKKLFPHGLWKEFTLETNVYASWSYPNWTYIDCSPTVTLPTQPWITCASTNASSGTYTVDPVLTTSTYYVDIKY